MRTLRCLVASTLALAVLSGAAMAAPSGSLKIAGSTTVLPLSQVQAEAFMGKYPNVSISVSGGGSGTGLSMLLNSTCDVANASRPAKKKEIDAARTRNSKLVATKLAKDGLSIIVHPSNNVKNVTMAQLASIYGGKTKSWKELGGDSGKGIVVVGRDTSSGTYGFFQDAVLGGGAYTKEMLNMPSNAAVAQAVAQSKDAIGYVGMAYAEEFDKAGKVRVISVSRKTGEAGVMPTESAVQSGQYPLFRYLYAYTAGSPKGLAADFLKFCTSPEGQGLVKSAGYLPLK
jgi:phosphate transport system substrate-binding protein